MSGVSEESKREFRQWIEGPGASVLGGAIKASAKRAQRRLEERLSNGNLFAHLEHEDKVALEKAKQAEDLGNRIVTRSRRRKKGMKVLEALLKASAPPTTPGDET